MSEIIDGKDTSEGINKDTPLQEERLESEQASAEEKILRASTKIKSDLTGILGDEEVVKNNKGPILGTIEHYLKQVSSVIDGGGSEQFLKELVEFKSFLEQEKNKVLATLTSEEKAELDKPKSTGTGTSNTDAYKANRYYGMARKNKGKRMF